MPYAKTNWNTAKITADNFNKLQTQYAEAVADAIGIRANGTAELRAEVVSSFPAHAPGRIIYHTGLKMFFYSTGTEWLLDPKETFWGDAQNGVFSSTGSVTFTNTLGATVIRNYLNFTLNPGHTITTQTGCRCLVIRSWGDIVINGVIDLDYKGGLGNRYISIGRVQYDLLGGFGGNGGAGGIGGAPGGSADAGQRGAGGLRGGGGGGGGPSNGGAIGGPKNARIDSVSTGGIGGEIDVGQSGTQQGQPGLLGGGGGGVGSANNVGYARGGRGGGGGSAWSSGGGGGGATSLNGSATGEIGDVLSQGGGGVLVLLAMGNITINGQIRCRGGQGGPGGQGRTSGDDAAGGGGGGGGSGGGRVVAIRRGAYNNAGSVLLTGGPGGVGGSGRAPIGAPSATGATGSQGETGTISTYQL